MSFLRTVEGWNDLELKKRVPKLAWLSWETSLENMPHILLSFGQAKGTRHNLGHVQLAEDRKMSGAGPTHTQLICPS